MLFEAEPEHVAALDSTSLVRLMKRLMLAEGRQAGIPLRSASAPLQITVADGGEDGRMEWTGGSHSTAYVPSRFTIFQSKAQDLNPSTIRAETHKKAKGKPPALNDALTDVLARGGAYVVFCNRPFTTKKRESLVRAIGASIKEVGGDPDQASSIDVYDANLIADWVNTHPPVALWLASQRLGRPLQGFQTHESWGRSPEIANVPWRTSDAPRFTPVNVAVAVAERVDPARSSWTYDQAVISIRDFLSKDGALVRIAGPSGFGKTRFAYEMLGPSEVIADQIDTSSVMYADGTISGDDAVKLAMEMADTGLAAIIVIDECNDDLHTKLANMVQRAGSRLRLVTLDIETRILQASGTLSLRLEKADNDHIRKIAKGVAPALSDADGSFIAQLAEGFPRVAVLAAQHGGDGHQILESVEQVLNRLIWGANPRVVDAERALEIASLFEWIGIQGRVDNEVAFIATHFASMSPAMFVEHLLSFRLRGIITRRGDFVQVGPLPLAARLGVRRLASITADQLARLFQSAPDSLKTSLLKRMKWLDVSPVAKAFVQRLLDQSMLGNLTVLNTEPGSKCLDQLVHVDPNAVSLLVERVFGRLTVEQLKTVVAGRRYLVWTLEKLIFRKATFDRSATLLRKLAVAENENFGNNATELFKQLYHLHLSGTEAEPSARLLVLDEGLSSSIPREREISVEALGEMLNSGHFSRSGGSEQIGSEILEDWRPRTYGEKWDFYRAAITRLTRIATSEDPLAKRARDFLGQHVRGLVDNIPLDDVKEMISTVSRKTGFWPEALLGISSWMYFDSKAADQGIASEIRAYFDRLIPEDPIDAVDLYTKGWQIDFHDPDSVYDAAPDAKHDFNYSTRKSTTLAIDIAADGVLLTRAVDRFACSDAKNIGPFARQLAMSVADPKALFSQAIQVVEASEQEPNRAFFSGLISGADTRDQALARSFVRAALASPKLKSQAISLIGSGQLQPDDIALVVALLRGNDVEPWQCAGLSYGRGLDHMPSADFLPLLQELEDHGAAGLWTILDILGMYLFGGKQPDKLLVKLMKKVLTNPALMKETQSNMDGYHLEETVVRLAKLGEIDVRYARQLTKQLLSICDRRTDSVFFALDDPVRKSLNTLMGAHPDEVWAMITKKVTSQSRLVRHSAKALLEANHRDDQLGRGLSIHVPGELILKWVRQNPSDHAPIAVSWMTIAVNGPDGTLLWSREVEEFVREFGDIPNVLDALHARLSPMGWWGSLALAPLVPLLENWLSHSNGGVRRWASSTIDALRNAIREEQKRTDEDAVWY